MFRFGRGDRGESIAQREMRTLHGHVPRSIGDRVTPQARHDFWFDRADEIAGQGAEGLPEGGGTLGSAAIDAVGSRHVGISDELDTARFRASAHGHLDLGGRGTREGTLQGARRDGHDTGHTLRVVRGYFQHHDR